MQITRLSIRYKLFWQLWSFLDDLLSVIFLFQTALDFVALILLNEIREYLHELLQRRHLKVYHFYSRKLMMVEFPF